MEMGKHKAKFSLTEVRIFPAAKAKFFSDVSGRRERPSKKLICLPHVLQAENVRSIVSSRLVFYWAKIDLSW